MSNGFGSGSAPALSHGIPASLKALQIEVESLSPEQQSLKNWLEASSREPLLADVILCGNEIEERVCKVLKKSGPVGDDHFGTLRLLGLSLASSLLDEAGMRRCQQVELASDWLQAKPSRVAWSLAVGAGKTLMAASLCRAVADLLKDDSGLNGPLSRGVLYSCRTHKLIEGMLKALEGMGVPRQLVGVFHGTAGAELDSINREDLGRFPILLTTQAQLQAASAFHGSNHPNGLDLEGLLVYGGKDRLCIWDEAFQSSLAESVITSRLAIAIGAAKSEVERLGPGEALVLRKTSEHKRTAADVVTRDQANELIEVMDQAVKGADALAAGKTRVNELRLPAIDELQVHQLKNWAGLMQREKNYGNAEAVESFAEMTAAGGLSVSLLKGSTSGSTMVRPRVVISDRLRRLTVLDASYTNSVLSGMDPTVQLANGANYALRELTPKRFSQVSVNFSLGPSGRGVDGSTGLGNSKDRASLIKQQAERVRTTPTSEYCLIVTYTKKGSVDFRQEIEAELDRKVSNWRQPLNGRPRVEIITWGEHVGSNDWRHCQHLFFVGVLRRSWPGDLDGATFASAREDADLWKGINPSDVEVNQACCEVMQAIGRGNARSTINGEAGRMEIHLPWVEGSGKYQGLAPQPGSPMWTQLEQMMPGARLVTTADPRKSSDSEQMRDAVLKALELLPADLVEIKTTDLKPLAFAHLPGGPPATRSQTIGVKAAAEEAERRVRRGQFCWMKKQPEARTWSRVA